MPSACQKDSATASAGNANKGKVLTCLEEALRCRNTAIIGDTLHFETLSMHDFDGTTVNPVNILDSLTSTDVFYHAWAAVRQTVDEYFSHGLSMRHLLQSSMERFLFELGNIILDRVEGPHFTFVDPRQHADTAAIVKYARRLVSLFKRRGITRGRILVSIPATEQGVAAARELEESHGIHTNLYLVTGLVHAAACVEARATAVTIPVGTLLDWYERKRASAYQADPHDHAGIETIQSTVAYFKLNEIPTKVIGSDFRTLSEIEALRDFDGICVTREQADLLRWTRVPAKWSESRPAALRGHQALYPSRYLDCQSGFMSAMSSESRRTVSSVMFATLGAMKAYMDDIETIVLGELAQQYELRTQDLKGLYSPSKDRSRKTPEKAIGQARRSLAGALGLDDPPAIPLVLDKDEIF